MDAKDQAAFKQQLRSHFRVFFVLVAVVAINVAVTFLPLDRPLRTGIQVVLAVLGGGLVLAFFMHLLTEQQSTLVILGCTAVLFAALMALPIFAGHDHPALTESLQHPAPHATNQSSHVP